MTLREAAQQALEALEDVPYMSNKDDYERLERVTTALRQALETEQEPVAWRTFDGEGGYDYRSYEMNETYDKEWAERNPNHKGWVEPLYTAPPKKQWVGLTYEEHDNITDNYHNMTWTLEMFARAVEQALKEKNT